MNVLKNIVNQLSKDEIRAFKYYAERLYSEEGRKDIELFDTYRKLKEDVDERVICKKLYGSEPNGAYYRLKNRLVEEINKSIVLSNIDKNKTIECFHLISLYHYYTKKQNYELGYHFLKKALKIADENEEYELLDMIYGELIKLSKNILSIDLKYYIDRRNYNAEKLNLLRRIDEIHASLSQKLKFSQNIKQEINELKDFLLEIQQISSQKKLLDTIKLKVKIYKTVSQLLILSNDYESLVQWTINNLEDFKKQKIFNHDTEELFVEMYIYIINGLNAQKKYKEALSKEDELFNVLKNSSAITYNKYIYFYYQSKVASLQQLNTDEAIETLLEMQSIKQIMDNDYYQIFIYTNLAILYFNSGKYIQCTKNLNRAYLNTFFQKLDNNLKTALYALEVMVRYEMEDFEINEYRLNQIKKDLKQWNTSDTITGEIILLIEKMIHAENLTMLVLEAKKIIQRLEEIKEENIVDIKGWLKLKFNKYIK